MVVEAQQAAETAGALGSLGVNGKLFLAQLANFGVVLFVMWRWVYRPLLAFMDERAAKIEKGLKDSEAASLARHRAEAEVGKLVTAARHESKKIIEAAEAEARIRGEEMLGQAARDVAKAVLEGKEQLKADRQAMLAAAKAELAGIVVQTAEKVLADVVDAKKDAAQVRAATSKHLKKI